MFHCCHVPLCNPEVVPPSSYQVLPSPLQTLLHRLCSKLLVIQPWLFRDAKLCLCDAEKLMVMISNVLSTVLRALQNQFFCSSSFLCLTCSISPLCHICLCAVEQFDSQDLTDNQLCTKLVCIKWCARFSITKVNLTS